MLMGGMAMVSSAYHGIPQSCGQGPSPLEVEEFVLSNQLNERAAHALRTVPPAVQQAVLDLGGLQGCRDPSAGCLGRIHRFQMQGLPVHLTDPGLGVLNLNGALQRLEGAAAGFPLAVSQEEIDTFIIANNVNERAANALRTVGPVVQRAVIDLGSLLSCRDPSAGLLGRIHRAQSGHMNLGIAGGCSVLGVPGSMCGSMALTPGACSAAAVPAVASPEDVEIFITNNMLSERAAGALRTVPPAVQRGVMDLGSLLSCRDPNAGCLGRIRDLQTGKIPLGMVYVPQQMQVQVQPCNPYVSPMGCHAVTPMQAPNPQTIEMEVEQFIIEHDLNERAASALRSVGPVVQKKVLDLGSLRGCRSTSAGCLGRIQRIQTGGGASVSLHASGAPPPTMQEIERFIAENHLNEKAAHALRTVGPAVQRHVLDLGSLQGCREPSAGCLGRIRDTQCGRPQVGALATAKGGPVTQTAYGVSLQVGASPAWRYAPY